MIAPPPPPPPPPSMIVCHLCFFKSFYPEVLEAMLRHNRLAASSTHRWKGQRVETILKRWNSYGPIRNGHILMTWNSYGPIRNGHILMTWNSYGSIQRKVSQWDYSDEKEQLWTNSLYLAMFHSLVAGMSFCNFGWVFSLAQIFPI